MINGIDIYHGNNINPHDFADMAKSNSVYFAFIKATTGGNGKDSKFIDHWQMARKAGIVCGAYHFFWPITDSNLQVNNFVTQYKMASRAGVLPPVVDIEWTKTDSKQNEYWNQVLTTQRILIIKDYLQKIELILNVKPIIYTAYNFWQEYITPFSSADDDTFFAQYKLWIADPNGNRNVPIPWRNSTPLITQNHFGDNVPSSAPLFQQLDNDIFNGNLKDFLNAAMPGLVLMKGFPYSMVVKDLQQVLKTKNFLADTADGFFGTNTDKAVISFQNANGLLGNGVVDAQTWNKILS
jgi:hypothetical protein